MPPLPETGKYGSPTPSAPGPYRSAGRGAAAVAAVEPANEATSTPAARAPATTDLAFIDDMFVDDVRRNRRVGMASSPGRDSGRSHASLLVFPSRVQDASAPIAG